MKIGSMLACPVYSIEATLAECLNKREETRASIRTAQMMIEELDIRIEGYRHALKILQDESNRV